MATRSMIAFDNGDEIYAIYCHFDGYPDGVGRVLNESYTDIEKVEQLMDLGDLSMLGKEIGENQHFGHNTDWCLAYGRDRGEKNCEALTYVSLQHLKNEFYKSDCEYLYIFDGKEWTYIHCG
jgi:hypothetical protein